MNFLYVVVWERGYEDFKLIKAFTDESKAEEFSAAWNRENNRTNAEAWSSGTYFVYEIDLEF